MAIVDTNYYERHLQLPVPAKPADAGGFLYQVLPQSSTSNQPALECTVDVTEGVLNAASDDDSSSTSSTSTASTSDGETVAAAVVQRTRLSDFEEIQRRRAAFALDNDS